jgi:hypothetical protein
MVPTTRPQLGSRNHLETYGKLAEPNESRRHGER